MVPNRILVLLLAFLPGIGLLAQSAVSGEESDRPLRIEIPARSVNETYRILPCGKSGMILFYRSTEIADETRTKWYFSLYDTNLLQSWTRSAPLINELDFRFSRQDGDTLSMLFLHTGKSRSAENDFEILRINVRNGIMRLNPGKLRQDAEVAAFGLQGGRGWLGYNVKGQSGKILQVRLDNGYRHTFDLGQGSQISLRWMQPDSTGPTVSCVVRRQVSKKILEHYLVKYDTTGSIRSELPLASRDDGSNLAYVQVVPEGAGSKLILGCYGQGTGGGGQKDRPVDPATGFFAIRIAGGEQKSTQYVNFLDLKNAGSLLSEHDIMSLKKKALKKNKALSEYSLDYTLLLHPSYSWNDQYVLVAEVFMPQYHTESYTDFDYYGRPYTNSFSVFDGYRFYNTIVAGFDHSGKLVWDNTMEIRNLVSYELAPKIVLFPSGENLVLCYLTDGKIGSKIIREGRVVEKTDFAPVDMMHPGDKLLSETKGKILPWYGNYFITCGYQEIKNIALESENKRLVYYFSKIRFDE